MKALSACASMYKKRQEKLEKEDDTENVDLEELEERKLFRM